MSNPNDLTASEARSDFGPTLERVYHKHERVRIVKHGRPMAALVPVEDLELLERLEDLADIEAARVALAEGGEPIGMEELWKELEQQE